MDFPESLDQPPWPTPDADLLAEDPDWWLVACEGWSHDRWFGYVSGYLKAAALIAGHVAETGRDQDTLIFPFLMCWRHYVELQLKVLIMLIGKYHGEPVPIPKTHKIDQLRKLTRPLLERAFPDDDAAAVLNAERVLLQLNELDPSSEHFRYPLLNDGSETLPRVQRLHIRRFHEAMDGVAHLLDAVDTALHVMIEEQAEYAAAMADYADTDSMW